jgi:hypothetical protein
MDCVGDGAGEAAVLRSRKGFFNHFARFPDSFTGMASMRTFGGKRCYRTSGKDSKGKLTAVCSLEAGKTDRCGWLAWLPMSPQDNCSGAIRAGVVYSEESDGDDGDLFDDSDCVSSLIIDEMISQMR